MMGGNAAHEFMLLVDTNAGEEVICISDDGEYAANVEKAEFRDPKKIEIDSKELPMETVDTPGAATIKEVTAFLKVKSIRLAKTLMYMADGKPVAAMVRGDRDLNEVKLKNCVRATELEMATPEEVEKYTNAPVGFAGPVGLHKDVQIIVDPLVAQVKNLIVGGNANEKHILNVNIDRDYKATTITDITLARKGDISPVSDGKLGTWDGIELGNTFQLGTKYSETLGAKFLDKDGKEQPAIMGSYGIGVTRTPQAVIEKHHDDKGIIWPKAIAPFLVELVPLNMDDPAQVEAADKVYAELNEAGIDVLMDDRDDRPGVKFNDADLIGCPVRLTIGPKSLKDRKIEMKARSAEKNELVDIDKVVEAVKKLLETLN